MLKFFKNKSVISYFMLGASVLAIVASILSLVNPGFPYSKIDLQFSLFCLIASVLSILAFIFNIDFLPLLAVLAYSYAFGRIIYSGALVVADKANNISYVGGNFNSIIVYLVLILLAIILSSISCFCKTKN